MNVSHELRDINVSNENDVSVNLDFEPGTSSDSSESLISDDNLCDNSYKSAYENVRRSSSGHLSRYSIKY